MNIKEKKNQIKLGKVERKIEQILSARSPKRSNLHYKGGGTVMSSNTEAILSICEGDRN